MVKAENEKGTVGEEDQNLSDAQEVQKIIDEGVGDVEFELKDTEKQKQEKVFYGAPIVSDLISHTQFSKYHNPRTGPGFAAEDANALNERLRRMKVDKVGISNELNGPDRITDGQWIQTKYYATPEKTLMSFFDSDGCLRYDNQLLEVPSDQYDDIKELAKKKIANRELKDSNGKPIKDPNFIDDQLKKGDYSLKQSKNIAKAGTVDSIVFDIKNNAIVSLQVMGISFGISLARHCWNGEELDDAILKSLQQAIAMGSFSLVTGVITSQILRTHIGAMATVTVRPGIQALASTQIGKSAIETIAKASLGKAVYGAAATNHISKLLGGNAIIAGVTTAVTSVPDFYRAMFEKNISWTQFSKNLSVGAAGVAGSMAGWAATTGVGAKVGAVIGSVVPGMGTIIGGAVGGVVGGLLGAFAGGSAASSAAKSIADGIADDDSKTMILLLNDALKTLAFDYLLSEAEWNNFIEKDVKGYLKENGASFFKNMYGSGEYESTRTQYAYDFFEKFCEKIVSERKAIHIDEAIVNKSIQSIADKFDLDFRTVCAIVFETIDEAYVAQEVFDAFQSLNPEDANILNSPAVASILNMIHDPRLYQSSQRDVFLTKMMMIFYDKLDISTEAATIKTNEIISSAIGKIGIPNIATDILQQVDNLLQKFDRDARTVYCQGETIVLDTRAEVPKVNNDIESLDILYKKAFESLIEAVNFARTLEEPSFVAEIVTVYKKRLPEIVSSYSQIIADIKKGFISSAALETSDKESERRSVRDTLLFFIPIYFAIAFFTYSWWGWIGKTIGIIFYLMTFVGIRDIYRAYIKFRKTKCYINELQQLAEKKNSKFVTPLPVDTV